MLLTTVTGLALLSGCPQVAPVDAGPFAIGCPEPGAALAGLLPHDPYVATGPDSLARAGDAVLMNGRAAFVIGAPDPVRTWYPYGGVPLDALTLTACRPSSDDHLGELGVLIGRVDLEDFDASTLRMFRGDALEVVSDGSDGGAAVVEVHGTDDRFWLVEQELIKSAYERGGVKPLSEPYGIDVTVRYTLAPGDAVLQMDVVISGDVDEGFLVGAFTIPSDRTDPLYYQDDTLSFGGLSLDAGVPWFTNGSPDGSVALAMPGANMALTAISGTTTLVDLNQALEPVKPGFSGEVTVPMVLAVGSGQSASASCELAPWLEEPVPGLPFDAQAISGTVLDPSGDAAAGTSVEVLALASDGAWRVLDRLQTDDQGHFSGVIAGLDKGTWQLRATGAGRDRGDTVEVALLQDQTLVVGAAGWLDVETVDDTGGPVPARVEVERSDGSKAVFHHVPGDGGHPLAPGDYDAWISRGYEHSVETASFTVPDDGSETLAAVLTPWLDTAGWISVDSHLHAEPSPDSRVLPVDRMKSAAAGGLEVPISTDHEAIVDLSDAVAAAGVQAWVHSQLGSEITATLPEHVNAWTFPARPDHARGEPVAWQGQGFPDLFANARERGATVIQVNHARVNGSCGILCLLAWDRLSELPGLDDPTVLGLPADEPIWSWDLDAFEVMNSTRSPFLDPGDPNRSGAFEDWLSFHNLGHRVAGMAVTDAHGADIPGQPRSYLAVDDDDPATVTDAALDAAVLAGAVQMSAGAFARVSIDGAGPGEQATAVDGEVTLDLELQALAEIDLVHVEILANCDEVAEVVVDAPDEVVKHDGSVTLTLTQDASIVVVGMGTGAMPRGLEDYDAANVPRVVTNPIFVDVDGDGAFTPAGPKACTWSPVLGESSR